MSSWEKKKLEEFFETHYRLKEKEKQLEALIKNYEQVVGYSARLRKDNEKLVEAWNLLFPDLDPRDAEQLLVTARQINKYRTDNRLIKFLIAFQKFGFKALRTSARSIKIKDFDSVLVITKQPYPDFIELPGAGNIEITTEFSIGKLGSSEAELVLLCLGDFYPSATCLKHMKEFMAEDNTVAAVESTTTSQAENTISGELTLVAKSELVKFLDKETFDVRKFSNFLLASHLKISVHPFAIGLPVKNSLPETKRAPL